MNSAMNTKQCQNCKKDILLDNHLIHSIHCQKFFFVCVKCGHLVRYNQADEHEATNHAKIDCYNCCETLEMCHLMSHIQNECLQRNIKCSICDVEIKAINIVEHEDYCGSRTEKCLNCNEFIMLKHKMMHIDSNHVFFKAPDEPGPSPSRRNRKILLSDFIQIQDPNSRSPTGKLEKKTSQLKNKKSKKT